MKPLPVGAMKHYCPVQERATTIGTYGEQAITWSDVAGGSVWMAIVPLYGYELQAAQQHLCDQRREARVERARVVQRRAGRARARPGLSRRLTIRRVPPRARRRPRSSKACGGTNSIWRC